MKPVLYAILFFAVLFTVGCTDDEGPITPIKDKNDTTEVNEAPYEILLSNTVFEEKYDSGYVVGTFSVLDPNANDEHQLLLASGVSSWGNQYFTIDSNKLVTKRYWEYNDTNKFNIRVWCSDGEFSFEKTFEISLIPYIPQSPVITSIHFLNDSLMPTFVHKDSANQNPQIEINSIPRLTTSMAIMMVDVDASNAVHWAVWNIPVEKDTILQGEDWSNYPSVVIGDSDFGAGYQGPFPPTEHHYEFKGYCLTDTIALDQSQSAILPLVANSSLLSSGTLVGRYAP